MRKGDLFLVAADQGRQGPSMWDPTRSLTQSQTGRDSWRYWKTSPTLPKSFGATAKSYDHTRAEPMCWLVGMSENCRRSWQSEEALQKMSTTFPSRDTDLRTTSMQWNWSLPGRGSWPRSAANSVMLCCAAQRARLPGTGSSSTCRRAHPRQASLGVKDHMHGKALSSHAPRIGAQRPTLGLHHRCGQSRDSSVIDRVGSQYQQGEVS